MNRGELFQNWDSKNTLSDSTLGMVQSCRDQPVSSLMGELDFREGHPIERGAGIAL